MRRGKLSAPRLESQRFWKRLRRNGETPACRKAPLSVEVLECRNLPSVTLSGGYTGFGFDLNNPVTPPDTQMAAGPTTVMEAVNGVDGNLAIINKSGGAFTDTFAALFSGVRVEACARSWAIAGEPS